MDARKKQRGLEITELVDSAESSSIADRQVLRGQAGKQWKQRLAALISQGLTAVVMCGPSNPCAYKPGHQLTALEIITDEQNRP